MKKIKVLICFMCWIALVASAYGNEKTIFLKQIDPLKIKESDYSGDSMKIITEAVNYVKKKKGTLRVYGSSSLDTLLIESCGFSKKLKDGIYLIENHKNLRYYSWYDKKFSRWACNEECNSDKDCYYVGLRETSDAPINGLIFFYYINLSEGYFNLKLLKDRLQVIDSKNFDHPS